MSRPKTYPNPWPAAGEPEYSATEEPAAALSSAMAYWANPLLSDESDAVHRRVRAVVPERTARRMAAEPVPRAAPERAADADRDLSRHAGELSMARDATPRATPAATPRRVS